MNRYRFLIVENRAGSAKDLEERLAGMGCLSLGRVAKGDPLLETVRECRPDMVLMDVRHRGLAGAIRTALQIRGHFRLPVFFITARSEGPLTDRRGLCDPFTALRDPFDAPEFQSLVETEGSLSGLDSRQKHIEMELRESNDRRSALFEGARDAILIADADTGILLEANTEAERLLGRPRAEIIGLHQSQIHPSQRMREFGEMFRHHVSAGGLNQMEMEIQRADGRCVPVEVSSSVVTLVGGQRLIQGFFRDITDRKISEKSLTESMDRFHRAMGASSDGLWDWDLIGETIYFSPGCFRMLGYEPDELPHSFETWLELLHPEDRKRTIAAYEDCLRDSASSFQVEFRARARDGSWRWILARVKITGRNPDGRPLDMIGTHVDITDRKAAEQALRESEERYRSLLETTCDWIWELDTHGRYSYASPKVIDILGYAPGEIVGRTPFEFMPEEEALRISRIFAEIDAERKPFAGLVNVNLHRDGRQVVLESSGVPVFGRDGEFQGYRGMDRDITERKASDRALFESEERLKLALDASHMGVWEWDLPTGTVYWSPECCGILGVEDLEGTIEAFTETVHAEDVARITASAKRALKERTAYAEEYRIIRRDGELRWVSNFARTSYDRNGRPLRVVGTIQDITDRKQTEERRNQVEAQLRHGQKMEALGTLAGGIAHDFNNILTIISGYAEMACWGLAAESPLHDELRQILNATDRARDLVQQILAFSRRSEQEKRPVQVDSIVKEALKMLRASLPSTIEIKSRVTSKTFALADPTQIHQVLMNLCTNASHAMRERGGLLEVSLTDVRISPEIARFRTGLQPGPHVQLAVKDTGHGIDPSVLDRIFDPFFTTKEPGSGTGLGLSVVHGIVKSHGGAIEVESAPGEGAAFYVFIPAMEGVAEPDPAELDALPCGHERILFVDDEPILATAAKRMLERLGYEVDYRPDGFEALLAYRRSLTGKPFDLVITDMTMPQLTGAELARELLRDRPELPLILSTGFSENMDEDKAEEIGARGFLMKPYTWRQLADLVRKVLSGD